LLVRSQQLKTDMTFGTWNVRSHYRSGSVTAAARELARNKLDLLDVQEVRWNKGGTVRGGDFNYFYVKKEKIINLEQVQHRIISAVKLLEFRTYRMSYIVLRGCRPNIIVLDVYAPCEEKSDDSKISFYDELGQVCFYYFPKHHMNIMLGNFNTKVGRENTFKPTIWNDIQQ